jgi:hypothetical protein
MPEKKKRARSRKGQPEWLPSNYSLRDGSIWTDARDDDSPDIFVCSAFEPLALLRDGYGGGWSLLLKFTDDDDNERMASVARSRLHGNGSAVRAELTEAGMLIGLASRDNPFDRLLMQINASSIPRGTIVHRPGWHGDVFVTPAGEAVATDGAPIVHYPGAVHGQRKGDAAEQIAAVKLAFEIAGEEGNDLYALASLAGGAGCIVDRAELDGTPIVGATGASSKGKTSAAVFGASIFGDPESGKDGGGLQPLRGTVNAFELIAERRTGAALFLDEPAGASKRAFDLGELVFMISGGSGKPRGKQGDALRRTPTWRTFAFLTAEFSVRQLAEQSRGTVSVGFDVRAIDIDASCAAWLPDDTFKALMAVRRHYGHVGPILAKHVAQSTAEDWRDRIEQRSRELVNDPEAPQMKVRAASVLAVLQVTGEAYEALGFVPLGAVKSLIKRTWRRYVDSEASAGLSPVELAAENLKNTLHGRMDSDVLPRDGVGTGERYGKEAIAYYERDLKEDGTTWFFVPIGNLAKLANTSLKTRVLVKELQERGDVIPAGDKNIAWNQISRALPLRHYRLRYTAEAEKQGEVGNGVAVVPSNVVPLHGSKPHQSTAGVVG